ncbi:hypothetical protein BGZ94_005432 [Podila epigama]|nr:hypothetical protein BGZ94_005432 [Podila epigama]
MSAPAPEHFPVLSPARNTTDMQQQVKLQQLKLQLNPSLMSEKAERASVRKAASAPAKHYVPVDEYDSTHAALKRMFEYTLIPVHADGVSIDWERIHHEFYVGAPTLNLSFALNKAQNKDSLALPAALAISSFLDSFCEFYGERFFDYLAWRYMEAALRPSGLGEEFKTVIEMHPVETRKWKLVSEYVNKLTQLDGFLHLVRSHHFALRLEPGETALAFVMRVKNLVRAVRAEGMGHHLSELIFYALPIQGQDEIRKTYPKGPSSIVDYNALLNQILNNSYLVKGNLADPLEYIAYRWAKPLANVLTRKRPHSAIMPTGFASATIPPAPIANSVTRVNVEHDAINSAQCTHILCKSLGHKHTNGQCLRKTDRGAWRNLLVQNQTLVDRIKQSGKWPTPYVKSPMPVSTAVFRATSVKRPAKN